MEALPLEQPPKRSSRRSVCSAGLVAAAAKFSPKAMAPAPRPRKILEAFELRALRGPGFFLASVGFF